ncbi:hypothetical protein V1264_005158 [Littorina saxatilis]|uniref:Uncharacterized protein n=1 Tax=Littorina saxatilis TaxID=31220 RepID=A0AAN9G567_9CAEN
MIIRAHILDLKDKIAAAVDRRNLAHMRHTELEREFAAALDRRNLAQKWVIELEQRLQEMVKEQAASCSSPSQG